MRESFLSTDELLFLQQEKGILNDALNTLSSFPLPADDLSKLRSAIDQLDELFLIVAAGEFNAGFFVALDVLELNSRDQHGTAPVVRFLRCRRAGAR